MVSPNIATVLLLEKPPQGERRAISADLQPLGNLGVAPLHEWHLVAGVKLSSNLGRLNGFSPFSNFSPSDAGHFAGDRGHCLPEAHLDRFAARRGAVDLPLRGEALPGSIRPRGAFRGVRVLAIASSQVGSS